MASREEIEEVVMLPLTEVGSIKWTAARGQKMRELRGDIPLLNLSKKHFSKCILAAIATLTPQQLYSPITLQPQPGTTDEHW